MKTSSIALLSVVLLSIWLMPVAFSATGSGNRMSAEKGKMPGNMNMEQRRQMLDQRMGMMQIMLEQMLENHLLSMQK